MSKELIERVARAIADVPCKLNGWDEPYDDTDGEARAAILAVLDHFSESGNVTDGMVTASFKVYDCAPDPSVIFLERRSISSAMRAARDVVSRG